MQNYSYIFNAENAYIEELYEKYCQNPKILDQSWRNFFEGFEFSLKQNNKNIKSTSLEISLKNNEKELKVYKLIEAYRHYAHLKSKTNPIRKRRYKESLFKLENFGLSEKDLNTKFNTGLELGLQKSNLNEIIKTLNKVYLGPIGYEYRYIRDENILNWLKIEIENNYLKFNLSLETKKRIFSKLNEAVVFENFIHTKYIGQKRFSLEGGENLIPTLDYLICKAGNLEVENVVIGMAHRGRLNVLANIIGKTYEEIFKEFEGNSHSNLSMGDGDVKYHLGFSSIITICNNKKIFIELCPNPSHLEAVNPVVLGYTQAKGSSYFNNDFSKILPILIHGDAAISGQGICYETTQMTELAGYNVGGTIHIVINNQLGFTTDFTDGRSSFYCTDLAKIIEAPVIHVNGDDSEALIFAVDLAIKYRQKFKKDIFIDIICYRKYGHNEADEPRFTQPGFYKLIAKHPNPREVYNQKLIQRGNVDAKIATEMAKEFRKYLQERLNYAKQNSLPTGSQQFEKNWEKLRYSVPEDFIKSPNTYVSEKLINKIANSLVNIPNHFKPIRQIKQLLDDRRKMFFSTKELNWASAELLAYGTLLLEGFMVRLCGQDTERGTFSHRHVVIHDTETEERFCSLEKIEDKQGVFCVFNSILSEYGVLGFQYGYAMANPNALVIWEAQFGDFANGAQVIMDQFLSAAESKWQKTTGIVLLLPHGYEGQGPEHSSARLERYLQMCAEYNMIVANVTTPSNLFHILRRQLIWSFRKPLIIMSPKSLLRHPKVISPLKEFTEGTFKEIINDSNVNLDKIKKVLLCTGKIYYDLLNKKEKMKYNHVAIIRIEQLYPFPIEQFENLIKLYKKATLYWVQEEPENMGAWTFILRKLHQYKIKLISRKESASPAVGYLKTHRIEQNNILQEAFK